MEISFTPEQESQLTRLAREAGVGAEQLVRKAALRLLEDDQEIRAKVQLGLEQADRGEFVEDEQMQALLARLLQQ